MIPLLAITIDDRTQPADLERIRRNLVDAVRELQGKPSVAARIIRDVELADGVATPVPHGLSRPAFVIVSPPRGPSATGRIEEVRDGAASSDRYVTLKATGWGATITVDLEVK